MTRRVNLQINLSALNQTSSSHCLTILSTASREQKSSSCPGRGSVNIRTSV